MSSEWRRQQLSSLTQPGKHLAIDTRSPQTSARQNKEPVNRMRLNSGRARYIHNDRIWFHPSKPTSAGSKYLYQKVVGISVEESQRDCRITSPFKHWPQKCSPKREHPTNASEPGSLLKQQVIESINKYKGLVTLSDQYSQERVQSLIRPTKQGRLEPLFGRHQPKGPRIDQCVGIKSRSRSNGKYASSNSSGKGRFSKEFRPPSTGVTTQLDNVNQSGVKLSAAPQLSSVSSLKEQDGIRPFRNEDRVEESFPAEDDSNHQDSPFRVVHFATYSPCSEYDNDLIFDRPLSIEIKRRESKIESVERKGILRTGSVDSLRGKVTRLEE